MSSITDIRRMGSILERKGRGRIWGNYLPEQPKKKTKQKKSKQHYLKDWDKDLWD